MAGTWHGSEYDLRRLLVAVEHACTCRTERTVCAACRLLLDQASLDRLLAARERHAELQDAERRPCTGKEAW